VQERAQTARDPPAGIARHADRRPGEQRPSYAPDYSPIEQRWRQVKRRTTQTRDDPPGAARGAALGAAGRAHRTAHPAAVRPLRGTDRAEKAACPRAAEPESDSVSGGP
jgi:hypothetical protein